MIYFKTWTLSFVSIIQIITISSYSGYFHNDYTECPWLGAHASMSLPHSYYANKGKDYGSIWHSVILLLYNSFLGTGAEQQN